MTTPINTEAVSALRSLVSEGRNPRTREIDRLPVAEMLALINAEDALVAAAVEAELPAIAETVTRVEAAFRNGGRLVYIGAGTSGRLGVLDASECPPTFSVDPGMVVGIIAGGDTALRDAVEGAEDDREQGAADLRAISLSDRDVVVGIAVSGKTPYVLGALDYARDLGAGTVALTCNPGSAITRHAGIAIAPMVGPEVLTGSTRLKSGTAQKMVLNMISTGAMIRIGKTYENLMVDLRVSNLKLRTRAVGILCETTGIAPEEADRLLEQAGNDVKLALFMQMTGLDPETSATRLRAAGGVLRQAIDGTTRTDGRSKKDAQ
ncbi:MAG: N-acetylmuramic acid 6-phosphate etherase [Rhodobacteraceae bacterium]|nr:N-acetylmuramic acid 6-phosphate etherase [Paracoccaceae bacterium]MBR9822861.1 N-acetylmuramic acid 6-phosphate etherase [Paracoccaceae bacterium]